MQYRVMKCEHPRSGMFKVVEIHDVSLHETEAEAKKMAERMAALNEMHQASQAKVPE